MNKKCFATAINCMDGRVQRPVFDYILTQYGVDYVDMITEAGPDRILAENMDETTIASIRQRVEISVFKHHSQLIAVAGHCDCAGNPVDEEIQQKHLRDAVEFVRTWRLPVEVIGLWVDENWQATRIKD
jgi:hypothetical protein